MKRSAPEEKDRRDWRMKWRILPRRRRNDSSNFLFSFFLFFLFLLHSVVFHFLSNAIYINGKILLRLCDLTEDNHDDEKHTAASERDSSISQLVDGLALDERTREQEEKRKKLLKIQTWVLLPPPPQNFLISLSSSFRMLSLLLCFMLFSIIMWCNSS